MDEKKKHRIQTTNRTPLQSVIPLSTPFVVYIDPSSKCNFKCKFCPSGERDIIALTSRWMGTMDINLFKKAVDDLAEFETHIKALKLYKDGEPLVNRHFTEMVAYSKASGFIDVIETTTNGSLLTPQLIDGIIKAGLGRINISVYGLSDEDFRQFARAKVRFDTFLQNIRYLHENKGNCFLHIKTTQGISSRNTQDEFYENFGPYCDSIDVERISPFWPGYDFRAKYDLDISTKSGTFGQKLEAKLVCPYVFYALAVNSDGRVDLCSCDWTHDYSIGDAKKQSLKEIWNSRKLYDEQILQLKGLRMSHPLCRDCHEIMYESIDNIDPYREELLVRLTEMRSI
ncbi:MAG TPA: radical SAM/SPASM domain-containing protein [Smithellaceae bacterium]|nr:radical SAM/SPASM domain-containing protein [Smithellaceae bacterium]